MSRKKILIEGMHCASCASNAEKSIKKIKGVSSVNVSIMTKKGVVESDQPIPDDDIKAAVAKAGYKVVHVEEV